MLVQLLLLLIAIALSIPCVVIFIECCSAFFSPPLNPPRHCENIDIAVLMPAHNEADVITDTLCSLTPQLSPKDQLIVVADNCSDNTAELARAAGATVIERVDNARRGKGYALDCGLQLLSKSPPTAVVIIDADCKICRGSLHQLAEEAVLSKCPVQAVYLIDIPSQPTLKESVSLFSFKVKNLVRPLGLARFGFPCFLMGTGMAFPWRVLSKVNLASTSIVEDMKLGLDLAMVDTAPMLCSAVTVVAPLPPCDADAKTQRTRWEHGHLQMISQYCPQLLSAAIAQGRLDLLILALDLSVPPLALLLMLWIMTSTVLTVAAIASGQWLPVSICYSAGLALLLAIFSAWIKFAKADISFKMLLSIPAYVIWKIPVYLKFVKAPEKEWIRTNRKV